MKWISLKRSETSKEKEKYVLNKTGIIDSIS